MTTVGLLPHQGKAGAMEATARLISLLAAAGCNIRCEPSIAALLGRPELGVKADRFTSGLDLAIALGGDGALLRAAGLVYPDQVPLFGVNFGHMGFLAEVEAQCIDRAIERYLAGDYRLEERIMISAACARDVGRPVVGLNDAVITKGSRSRMISMEIMVNGMELTDYRADGLIVATPTGSTAYSLSAGGPILHPSVSALVVTPVCAHSLHARPLVVGAGDGISARILSPDREVLLVADGRETIELQGGDTVHFARANAMTRLVRFQGLGFYGILRQRFKEGKL